MHPAGGHLPLRRLRRRAHPHRGGGARDLALLYGAAAGHLRALGLARPATADGSLILRCGDQVSDRSDPTLLRARHLDRQGGQPEGRLEERPRP